MKHDPATPCDMFDAALGSCGATPTKRYTTGVRCRTDAPGATLDACQHGTTWLERCGRCEGDVPPPLATIAPTPHDYGPAGDYSGLTVQMQQGKKYNIRKWVEPAHQKLIQQRTDLNTLAQKRAARTTGGHHA